MCHIYASLASSDQLRRHCLTHAEVCEWLAGLPTASAARSPVTTRALSEDAVRAVQRAADVRAAKLSSVKPKVVAVRRAAAAALYCPAPPGALVEAPDAAIIHASAYGSAPPPEKESKGGGGKKGKKGGAKPPPPPPPATPSLGDRVLNLNAIGVPFGLRGTVVAAHHHSGQVVSRSRERGRASRVVSEVLPP